MDTEEDDDVVLIDSENEEEKDIEEDDDVVLVDSEIEEEARYLSAACPNEYTFLQVFLRRDYFRLLFENCRPPEFAGYLLPKQRNLSLAACLLQTCKGMHVKVRRYLGGNNYFLYHYKVRVSPCISDEVERLQLETTTNRWIGHLSTLDFHFQLLDLNTKRVAAEPGAVVREMNMTDDARAQLMKIMHTALLHPEWRQVFFCLRHKSSHVRSKVPTIPIVDCAALSTLMDYLVECSRLRTLFLDGFRMQSHYEWEKDEIFTTLGKLTSLETLKIKQNPEVAQLADDRRCIESIGRLTGLTGLQISLKDGSTDHLTRFGSMLRSLTGLTELKVTHHHCDDGAAAALMFTSLRSLKYLDVKHCKGFQLQPLVDVLKKITSLLPLELNVRMPSPPSP